MFINFSNVYSSNSSYINTIFKVEHFNFIMAKWKELKSILEILTYNKAYFYQPLKHTSGFSIYANLTFASADQFRQESSYPISNVLGRT